MVLVTGSAAWSRLGAGPAAGSAARVVQGTQAATGPVPRPFEHRWHEELPCRGCHGAGATHRTTRVRTALDCAACHHDPVRSMSCSRCHRPEALREERVVRMTLSLRVRPSTAVREVAFRHDLHVATTAGLTCRECHGTDLTLRRNRECGSCHARHHGGGAECSRCHAPPKPGAHDASVHLGCAGSGCHASETAPTPVGSRAVCLFCHADRRDHEPGGSCAACHRIPGGTFTARPSPGRGLDAGGPS